MLFKNIAETLAINAKRRPDHLAIISSEGAVDYKTFELRVGQTATMLSRLGMRSGDIVGIALRDNADHIIAMYACAWIGAIILPFDWRWAKAEKQNLASWFRPKLILVEGAQEDQDQDIEGHSFIYVDDAWRQKRDEQDPSEIPIVKNSEMGLLLSLSSGTTGRPKGPLLTHNIIQNRFIQHWSVLSFHEQDTHLISTPLYFGGGRMFALSHLFIGATIVLLKNPYTPEELIECVRKYQITTMFIVPTMLRRLLAMPDHGELLLPFPRYVISGGSALHPSERQAALERISNHLVNYYSSSEGGAVSLLLPYHQNVDDSVGRPVFMTEVEIVDHHDKLLGPNEIGLVRYRGPGVPGSLYMDIEASKDMFRGGWFYPGDLGRIDERGFLFLTGRAKDMIIRGGINIYPQDIERSIMQVQGVEDVAVVGWPSRAYGEEVAAFVVTSHEMNSDNIISYCKNNLAPYKIPRQIFFIDKLPRNSAGKIIKSDLAARLELL